MWEVFVYDNFDNNVSGVSFLPMTGAYGNKQAPYQDCTKQQYEEVTGSMPLQM